MEPLSGRPFPPVEGVEVTHRFIRLDGLKVHVAEAGEGEPLVMLHGWPQNWWMWRNQIPHFARHFRVSSLIEGIRMDGRPAIRISEGEPCTGSCVTCRNARASHFRLLSHDWGGWIGYIVCVKHPGLITQHYAANIPPLWPKISMQSIPAMMRLGFMARVALPYFGPRLLTKDAGFVHGLLTKGETRNGGWTDLELNAFSDQFRDRERARASAKLYRSFLFVESISVGLLRKYGRTWIKTPTRLLFGASDQALSPAWLRGYESHFNDILIEVVPRAGHFIIDERPELINERAMKFFRDPKFRTGTPPTAPERQSGGAARSELMLPRAPPLHSFRRRHGEA